MRVLILTNNDVGLYKFRRELIEELLKKHEVFICLPYGRYVDELCRMGCEFLPCELLDRHGTNPIREFRLLKFYKNVLKSIKPDMVFTYTIKPNVYGGMACSQRRISYVSNVTGLGGALENGGMLQKITLALYKTGLKRAQKVFFQNKENMNYMVERGIVKGEYSLLPGSGVNLVQYPYINYPDKNDVIIFLTIGRMMRDKGISEVIDAAKIIKKRCPHVIFRFIGDCDEEEYKGIVSRAAADGIIEYLGSQPDVKPFIAGSHATIHASYHEGMSNVLLETAASGRPIIATDVPGCADTFIPEVSGIAFKAKDVEDLVSAIEKFLKLQPEEKKFMGQMGRKKAESEFDRNIVVDAYMKELSQVNGRGNKGNVFKNI